MTVAVLSPDKARSHLDPSRSDGLGGDQPEGGICRAQLRSAEGHTIGDVESLESDLQILSLAESKSFERGTESARRWGRPAGGG